MRKAVWGVVLLSGVTLMGCGTTAREDAASSPATQQTTQPTPPAATSTAPPTSTTYDPNDIPTIPAASGRSLELIDPTTSTLSVDMAPEFEAGPLQGELVNTNWKAMINPSGGTEITVVNFGPGGRAAVGTLEPGATTWKVREDQPLQLSWAGAPPKMKVIATFGECDAAVDNATMTWTCVDPAGSGTAIVKFVRTKAAPVN